MRSARGTRHSALGAGFGIPDSGFDRAASNPESRIPNPAILATIAVLALQGSVQAQTRVLDSFDSATAWTAHPSDGVSLAIGSDTGRSGRAMRIDVDFRGGGGYAIARKAVAIDLAENYEFTFYVRGEIPVNTLEFKLIDPSGENVWWVNQRNFEFPREWRKVTIKKRHSSFAWGPAGGGEMTRVAGLEIVVTAASGGKGTVWIDDLAYAPLPPVTAYTRSPTVRASSAVRGAGAARALDGDSATAWRSASGGTQWLTVDFGQVREYGGLIIDWDSTDYATDYAVETSGDGARWDTAYAVRGANGGRDYVYLPETESRYVRLRLTRSARRRGYALREITVQPLAWSASRNDFFRAVARDAPRGSYPKYLTDSVQSYWTVIGVNGGDREGLLNEEGMLETGTLSFSVEPFLHVDGRLITWSDATRAQSLALGYLPVPSVEWTVGEPSPPSLRASRARRRSTPATGCGTGGASRCGRRSIWRFARSR